MFLVAGSEISENATQQVPARARFFHSPDHNASPDRSGRPRILRGFSHTAGIPTAEDRGDLPRAYSPFASRFRMYTRATRVAAGGSFSLGETERMCGSLLAETSAMNDERLLPELRRYLDTIRRIH